jgi:hypothetical protein
VFPLMVDNTVPTALPDNGLAIDSASDTRQLDAGFPAAKN